VPRTVTRNVLLFIKAITPVTDTLIQN
jgi:hypothetical protein